jgi:histidinol-phosphate/aromatic aminotransferase/cobyric acid decarboxylase-like protein
MVMSQSRRELVIRERARVTAALSKLDAVKIVWPSAANFLLVECRDAERAFRAVLAAGLLIRDVRSQPGLAQHLRITIGTPEQNDRLLRALEAA